MGKPTIRFKGYTDDWEQRKLDDLTEELSEYATMASGLPLLTSSRSGLMYQSDFRDRKTTTSDETLFSIVPKGSCTYRHMSDDDIFHMNINVLEKGLVSREYPVFISSENNDLEFIIQHINSSDRFRAFCKGQKKGGTRTRLYYKTLCEFEMMIPSIEEQKKISATLHSLDHLITLHQRKCDQAKILKKYMLQKMFPQNDEKVPKIRFKGFTDDWEQRKLGEVLVSLQNNTLSRADLSNEIGVAKNVHYGDVLIKFGEVLDVSIEQLPMISDESILGKYKASFLQNGDVIVADTAEDLTVGKCSEIAGLKDEVVLSGLHTIPYRPTKKFSSGYLGYYLNSGAYHDQLIPLMQGIKVTSISKSAMQDTSIIYPKLEEEQRKIGTYFRSLDELITLHQHKCEELKNIKKFMLQNMFVQEK